MQGHVAAIGQLNIDVLYSDFPGYPKLGEEVLARNFSIQLGGGPQTTMLALHRLGITTRFGTFYSNDTQSRLGLQLLEEFGYENYKNFYTGSGSPTVVTSVFSFEKDRAFLGYNECAGVASLPANHVYDFLKGSKVCFAPENEEVLKQLKSDGTLLVYDIGWQENLNLSTIAQTLKYVDFFSPNEKEAMKITNKPSPEKALRKLAEHTAFPVVKLGKEGCLILQNGKTLHLPAIDEFKPVDLTGAGDNFLAGVIFGLYNGWDLVDCVGMGNVMGGNSTTKLGCLAAEINSGEALAYFHKYKHRGI